MDYIMEDENNNIKIVSCQITKTITSFKIDILYIILNTLAKIRVQCFDENNILLVSYEFELKGDDYQLWKDDKDLIDYVCEKYNFVLKALEPSGSSETSLN